jgi:hypothetical protein
MFHIRSSTTAIRRYTAMVAAAGACAVVVTGCSSGGHAASHASPSAMSSTQTLAILRQLTQCIRQHGVPNFPDLAYDPQSGGWQPPPNTPKPPPSTMNACKSIADRLPAEGENRPPSAAEMAKLRAFSKCMRQHGIQDWPDPNADGAFPLPPRLRQGGKPMVRNQLQACQQYFPASGRIRMDSGSSGNGG